MRQGPLSAAVKDLAAGRKAASACSRSGIARRVTRPNCDTSSGALGQPHRKVAAAVQRGTDTGVGSLPTLMSFSYTFNNAIMAEYTALGDPKLASSKSDQEVLS
jgi:hypothetical protein